MVVATETPTASPPRSTYAAITVAFAGGLAATGGLARLLGRDPQEHTALDLAVLSAATFKASRTISRDELDHGVFVNLLAPGHLGP